MNKATTRESLVQGGQVINHVIFMLKRLSGDSGRVNSKQGHGSLHDGLGLGRWWCVEDGILKQRKWGGVWDGEVVGFKGQKDSVVDRKKSTASEVNIHKYTLRCR